MSTRAQNRRLGKASPVSTLVLAAVLAYAVVAVVVGVAGGVTQLLFCRPLKPGEGATMQCGLMSGVGMAGGALVAWVLLAYLGYRLRLRWWWVPTMIGLAVTAIWLGGLFPNSGLWPLASVPLFATLLAAPERTPGEARRTIGGAALLVLLLSVAMTVQGALAQKEKTVAGIEGSGVPVFAPTERRDLTLFGPSQRADTFSYRVRDRQRREVTVTLSRTVDRCMPKERPACVVKGTDVVTRRVDVLEIHREVPGGQLRVASRQLPEAELTGLLNDLRPTEADWLVDHLGR